MHKHNWWRGSGQLGFPTAPWGNKKLSPIKSDQKSGRLVFVVVVFLFFIKKKVSIEIILHDITLIFNATVSCNKYIFKHQTGSVSHSSELGEHLMYGLDDVGAVLLGDAQWGL